MLICE